MFVRVCHKSLLDRDQRIAAHIHGSLLREVKINDWNLFLGIKDRGDGKAACLLPEAQAISLLLGGNPEGVVTETCIGERTEVIYPALAPLSVGEMVKAMRIAKAILSQHLSVMRQKGILITRREGTTIYYRLARPKITEACAIMREVLMDSLADQEKLSKSIREGNQAPRSSGAKRKKAGKQIYK